MIFMLCLSVLYAVLAIHKPHRFEWCVLSILLCVSWFNTFIYDHNDSELYFIRSSITIIAGLMLVSRLSTLGLYHSFVLLVTLMVYGMLAYDVSQREHILIYNYYEAVIYGLVICQLLGIYPTLRACYLDFIAGRYPRVEHIQGGSRS